jgi:Ni/Fe-hydrogenase b-type cytochrome subunit
MLAGETRMMDEAATVEPEPARPDPKPAPPRTVYRHRWPTRIWHWVNALSVFVMLMSGLMILNAHPRLYWGAYGANFDQPWVNFGPRPFPGGATIPSTYNLAAARIWHFAFAWLLVAGLVGFLAASLWNRHVQRDLVPGADELAPRNIWRDVSEHARLRFPAGDAALRYNILQKLSYAAVIFLLLPLLILTGLAMSPAMDAAWPWLLDVTGGRQSARSIHFLCAAAIGLFILVHLAMVVLAGPLNQVRAMITGWFRVPAERRR